MTWKEYFVMGAWCWEQGDQQILITRRNRWDIDLNHTIQASRDTFAEAKAYANQLMGTTC